MIERLEFLITASGADAKSEFKSLGDSADKDLGRAEAASGKFGKATGFAKAHAMEFGMAAGAAIGTFALKAIGDFNDLALQAGQASDALGILPEDASRLIEVFGDVGVEFEKVEGAIGKMNKLAGNSPQVFKDLGVEIAKTKDGATDANETFIRSVERLAAIEDPAERAAAGTKLFGKSWGELAEVINSGDIRGALAAVSDAKVIDADEVRKAREMRDALDELKGFAEDATLAIGGALVPAVSDLTEEFTDFVAAVKAGDLGEITSQMSKLGDLIQRQMAPGFADMKVGMQSLVDPGVQLAGTVAPDLIDKFAEVAEGAEEAGTAVSDSALAYLEMQRGMSKAKDTAKLLDDNIGALTDTVNAAIDSDLGYQNSINATEDAMIELYGKVEELNKAQGTDRVAAVEAMERAELSATEAIVAQSAAAVKLWEDQVKAAGGTLSAADAAKIQRDELIKVASEMDPNSTLAQNLWGYIEQLGNIPGVVSTTIDIDNSEALRRIAEVRGKLNEAGILADTYGMGPKRTNAVSHSEPMTTSPSGSSFSQGGGYSNSIGGGSAVQPLTVNIYANLVEKDAARWIVEQIDSARRTMGSSTVQRAIGL